MRQRQIKRRGVALLLVIVVIGVASVLGFALLAETSLGAQGARNALLSAQADGIADSGINLAMYYLQHPQKAPRLVGTPGYWPGDTDLQLGADFPGSVDVSVNRDAAAPDEYNVVAVGKIPGGASGMRLRQTIRAHLRINEGLKVTSSVTASRSLNLAANVTVSGDVLVNGTLTNYGIVNGTATALDFKNFGTILSPVPLTNTETVQVPGWNSMPLAMQSTYVHTDGKVYQREALTVTAIGGGVLNNLGPTATNPAGIYYYDGSLTLNSNLRIDGTLIVTGSVVLGGTNVQITAQDGYPALLTQGSIRTKAGKSMVVNGLTWLGKSIRSDSAMSSLFTDLSFNGGVMFGDAGSIDASAGARVRLNYVEAKLNLPDLDTRLARSVTVVSWAR